MALFLLCPNLGWIQGQFNFTELSLRYREWNHLEHFAVIKKTDLKDDVDGGMRILSALYEDRRDLRKAFPDFNRGNPRSLLEWALNADKFGDCDAHLLKGLKDSFQRRLNAI